MESSEESGSSANEKHQDSSSSSSIPGLIGGVDSDTTISEGTSGEDSDMPLTQDYDSEEQHSDNTSQSGASMPGLIDRDSVSDPSSSGEDSDSDGPPPLHSDISDSSSSSGSDDEADFLATAEEIANGLRAAERSAGASRGGASARRPYTHRQGRATHPFNAGAGRAPPGFDMPGWRFVEMPGGFAGVAGFPGNDMPQGNIQVAMQMIAGLVLPGGNGPDMMGTLGEEQGTAIWNALAGNTELMQALQESFNMMPQGIPPPSEEGLATVLLLRVLPGDELDCPISMDRLESGVWAARMPCGHYFGAEALGEWLAEKNSCPSCRSELPTVGAPPPSPPHPPHPLSLSRSLSIYLQESKERRVSLGRRALQCRQGPERRRRGSRGRGGLAQRG